MNLNLSEREIEKLERELFYDVHEVIEGGVELRGIDYSEDHALNSLWYAGKRVGDGFEKQRDAFLWLLVDCRLKLIH